METSLSEDLVWEVYESKQVFIYEKKTKNIT